MLTTCVTCRGQTSHSLAYDEHANTANRSNPQALGTSSIDRLKPGYWALTKFRYMFCYRTCRTIPLSQPPSGSPHRRVSFRRLNSFQKHGFQRGGITLLNHAERVWEHNTKPTRNIPGQVPPRAIYPHVPAHPPSIFCTFCRFSVSRFDTTSVVPCSPPPSFPRTLVFVGDTPCFL